MLLMTSSTVSTSSFAAQVASTVVALVAEDASCSRSLHLQQKHQMHDRLGGYWRAINRADSKRIRRSDRHAMCCTNPLMYQSGNPGNQPDC